MPSAKPSRSSVRSNRGTKVAHAITIGRPPAEIHSALVDPEKFSLLLPPPARVTWLSATAFECWSDDSRVTTGELINGHPNQLLAWRTDPAGEFPHAGTVRFEPAPGDEGTEVHVQVEYEASLTDKLARVFGKDPGSRVKQTLRRLKALLEAGEIPTITGQPVGNPQRKKSK